MIKPLQIMINLAILTIVVFILVDLFYTVIKGKFRPVDQVDAARPALPEVRERRKPPLADFMAIVDRNIFGTAEEPQKEEPPPVVETLEPTSLDVVLLGTAIGGQEDTIAIIREPKKRTQNSYREGDTIENATIKKILRGKVVLRIGDRDEILLMDEEVKQEGGKDESIKRLPSRGNPPESVVSGTVRRSELGNSLRSINRLLSEVRIRPHFNKGKVDGLVLTRIKEDSIFSKLGIEDGDTLQGIGGKPIKRPNDIVQLYNRLKSGDQVTLEIDRKGQKKILNYNFE